MPGGSLSVRRTLELQSDASPPAARLRLPTSVRSGMAKRRHKLTLRPPPTRPTRRCCSRNLRLHEDYLEIDFGGDRSGAGARTPRNEPESQAFEPSLAEGAGVDQPAAVRYLRALYGSMRGGARRVSRLRLDRNRRPVDGLRIRRTQEQDDTRDGFGLRPAGEIGAWHVPAVRRGVDDVR